MLWWDKTFNPWWHCEKVSPACKFCYAERDSGVPFTKESPRRFFGEKHWNNPILKYETGSRVFCGSMCDVFEDRNELAPEREKLFKTIEKTPHLTWMLVTKRVQHIKDMMPKRFFGDLGKNIWIIVTMENQEWFDKRIPFLIDLPFVRGISAEPLLGEIDMSGYEKYIDWIITGGESGDLDKVRIGNPDWYRKLRDFSVKNDIPFFYKQWGEYVPDFYLNGIDATQYPVKYIGEYKMVGVGKKLAGHLLDDKEWIQYPKNKA